MDHLIACLGKLYEVDIKIEGTLYIRITLNWHYMAGYVDLSMLGYITNALKRFNITETPRPVLMPHTWKASMYGLKVQLTNAPDLTAMLQPLRNTRLQEIVGTLLFYGRCIDSRLLTALNDIGIKLQTILKL